MISGPRSKFLDELVISNGVRGVSSWIFTTQSKVPLNNTPLQSTDRRRIDIGRARIGQHHPDLKK